MALQEQMRENGNWLFKYRGVLPIIVLVLGLGFYIIRVIKQEALPMFDYNNFDIVYNFFCFFVGMIGLYIRFHTVGHAAENTSGKNTAEQKADSVNSTGFYSIVRHPLYLGNFFLWFGPALLTANLGFIIIFCLAYWVYYERIMYAEEAFMREKFGDKYLSWANTVPTFMPRLRGYKKPAQAFSWKKAIHSEKNAFAAYTIIFAMFNIVGELILKRLEFNYFFSSFAIIALLIYFIIKFLQFKDK